MQQVDDYDRLTDYLDKVLGSNQAYHTIVFHYFLALTELNNLF